MSQANKPTAVEEKRKPVVAVDLDGTLAYYGDKEKKDHSIGAPIQSMVNRIKYFINTGYEVVIFTARAVYPSSEEKIMYWLGQHGLPKMRITNIKDPMMVLFFDDRAVPVEQNTGKILGTNSHFDKHYKLKG